jgi:hypothetical protein
MAQSGNLIGTMIREGSISFVRIDKTVFVKNKAEKLKVKNIRNSHNRETRKMGYDPKKTLNPPGISL